MISKRRLIKFLIVVVVLSVPGVFLVYQNKYYVKKFIKSNSVLYAAAKKIAEFKHNVTNSSSKNKSQRTDLDTTNFTKTEWRLTFDAAKSLGKFERFWGSLGYESFKNGILSGLNRQLFEMIKETAARTKGAFRYVRAHNLFSDGTPPWGEGCVRVSLNEAGQLVCNWEFADRVFDTILACGLRPIIEFGFMPDVLASQPDRRQKWGRANISPPKNYQLWQELIYKTVQHFSERYGEDEISQWYFEVWNEPDLGYLFWVEDPDNKPWGDIKEYLKLYDYTVKGAKSACSTIKIGGPASAGGFIENILEHTLLEESFAGEISEPRIDFVSSHSYGYITDKNRKGMNITKAIQWKIGRAVEHDHPAVRKQMQNLPFLLTETGYGAQKKGKFNNSRYMAAWMSKLVTMSFYLGDRFGQAYQPDEFVFWSDLQVEKDFEPTRGMAVSLKSAQGRKVFKRPVYNAIEALGHLSNERIKLTEGAKFGEPVYALATKDENRSVEILIYHLNERDDTNSRDDTLNIDLTVKNLPFSKFRVEYFLIDETHSNVYSAWKAIGNPKKLTTKQVLKLAQSDDLEMADQPWQEESDKYQFKKVLKLQSNSAALFVLTNNES